MATESSEPSEREPQRDSAELQAAALPWFGFATQVAAVALALLGQLAASGALLLASALDVGRTRPRLTLASDSATSRLRPFLDLGLTAALIAGQTWGPSRSTLHGTGPWSLAGLSLVVAGARTVAPKASASSAMLARALLGAALVLAPIATLVAQITAANAAALEMYRKAWTKDCSPELQARFLALADKASRTVAVLAEALDRHRGRGQQQITVRHVTVNADQAMVADRIVTGGNSADREDGDGR